MTIYYFVFACTLFGVIYSCSHLPKHKFTSKKENIPVFEDDLNIATKKSLIDPLLIL